MVASHRVSYAGLEYVCVSYKVFRFKKAVSHLCSHLPYKNGTAAISKELIITTYTSLPRIFLGLLYCSNGFDVDTLGSQAGVKGGIVN